MKSRSFEKFSIHLIAALLGDTSWNCFIWYSMDVPQFLNTSIRLHALHFVLFIRSQLLILSRRSERKFCILSFTTTLMMVERHADFCCFDVWMCLKMKLLHLICIQVEWLYSGQCGREVYMCTMHIHSILSYILSSLSLLTSNDLFSKNEQNNDYKFRKVSWFLIHVFAAFNRIRKTHHSNV